MYGMAGSDLGVRIRRARERKRWSQQELADELSKLRPDKPPVGVRSVGRWERDEAVPRGDLGALEYVLGVDLSADREELDATEPALMSIPDLTPELQAEFRRMYRESLQGRQRAG